MNKIKNESPSFISEGKSNKSLTKVLVASESSHFPYILLCMSARKNKITEKRRAVTFEKVDQRCRSTSYSPEQKRQPTSTVPPHNIKPISDSRSAKPTQDPPGYQVGLSAGNYYKLFSNGHVCVSGGEERECVKKRKVKAGVSASQQISQSAQL